MIEMPLAGIEKYEADAARKFQSVMKMTWEGDFKAATKVFQIEDADYLATRATLHPWRNAFLAQIRIRFL